MPEEIAERQPEIEIVPLEEELSRSYLGYAMSTIIARALPDVRDGLKPVQRRILYAMREMGVTPNSAHVKCAAVCGETMKRFHPHGNEALYATLVRMAQDFSMRYPLIDGQGNFGSVDGDPPAAMRYTECRLSPLAMEMMEDIDKETVDWQPNYDQSTMEPMVLPGKFPNFICNGGSGIAVGMATNVPPHNLREVADAITYLIDHPQASVSDLMKYLPGPDFPTAGLILGTKGIREAYETGRGQVIMQAKTQIEPMDGGKQAIVITELPYQVNKAKLIEQIANLVKGKRIDGITAIRRLYRPHGDAGGYRAAARRQPPQGVELPSQAYADAPVVWGDYARAGRRRAARAEPQAGATKLHPPSARGDCPAYAVRAVSRPATRPYPGRAAGGGALLDEIIRIIRQSENSEVARRRLMRRFGFTQIQAEAILSMQLRQLTALEQQRLEDEYKNLLQEIAYLEDILVDERRVAQIIKQELKELKDKYGDDRRTRIIAREAEEIGEEDMIPEEEMLVTITRDGYIKRLPLDTYRSQRRGGKGVIATTTKEEDTLEHIFQVSTHHYILFFTDRGRVYRLKAYEVPQATRQARGTAVINLIRIEPGEKITATVSIADFSPDKYLVMGTRRGEVKRIALSEFANLRANGLFAFDLEEGDELGWVQVTSGNDELVFVTRQGMSLRFHESDLRSMGRAAGGVRGIQLGKDDAVVALVKVYKDRDLLVISEKGYGKRTPFSEYRVQGRGGKGIITFNVTQRTGLLVDAKGVLPDDRIIAVTAQGKAIRVPVSQIRRTGRNAQGVRIMTPEQGDYVTALARIVQRIDDEGVEEGEEA
jgi:DNA gyrase subunit A